MKTGPSPLPEPRSYIGTVFMLVGVTLLPIALVWSSLMAAALARPFGKVLPFGLCFGIFASVSFGFIGAFSLKGETATIEVSDRKGFIAQLNVATSQLGYNPATQTDDFFTYKPSFQSGLGGGRISVQLQEQHAIVVGPKTSVKKLVKRLTAE
jgi:hypothetical protein